MNRRAFLFGTSALVAAAVIPAPVMALVEPHLYGDGIHDDTVALQAFIDREFARVASDGGTVFIPHGTYLISGTMRLGTLTYPPRPPDICRGC